MLNKLLYTDEKLIKCLNRLRIAILFIASYYGKVTLFEGHKVVKAKKTSPVSAFSLEHKHRDTTSKSTTEPSTDACNKGKEEQDKLEKTNQDPEFEVINISSFSFYIIKLQSFCFVMMVYYP